VAFTSLNDFILLRLRREKKLGGLVRDNVAVRERHKTLANVSLQKATSCSSGASVI
jgi:hypothetical protein